MQAVVVVRNPFDTIVSYFNLYSIRNHTDSVPEEVYEKFADVWNFVVEENAKYIQKFFEFWMNQSKTIPVYFVRYEDLMLNREETLRKLLCFMLNTKSIEGTLTEALIKRAISEGEK